MAPQGLMYQLWDAIDGLVMAGVPAVRKAFGFSVVLVDDSGSATAECGVEHDFSISISVSTNSTIHWFFRPSVSEMVEFLKAAKARLTSGESATWLEALQATDNQIENRRD